MPERHYRTALLFLGHAVFIALAGLAAEHAVLRTTHGDTAFQVFQWISQPCWDIEAHRYSAIVPQAAVKFFALFGADLCTLLHVASLAHVLVGYGVFVLCAHVWKAQAAAMGCAIAAVLCTRLTFYSPVLEANYLLCFPFLAAGYAGGRTGRAWPGRAVIAFLALALAALFAHPMGWMVMLFVAVWLFVTAQTPMRPALALLVLAMAWPLITRILFPPTGYELDQYEKVVRGLNRFCTFDQWASLHFLRDHTFCITSVYLPALVTFTAMLAGWCLLRAFRTALLVLAGTLAFLLVYLITFHEGESAIMMDRGVLPVATFIAIGAGALLLRAQGRWWRIASVMVTATVLFVKFRDVSIASRPFRDQLNAANELIVLAEQQGITRGIVDCDGMRRKGIDVTWAFSAETLLRSAVAGPEHSRILICNDQLPEGEALRSGRLLTLHFAFAVDANGNPYFGHSDRPYQMVEPH
jgi:hypothetical protein